ncbi:MAG: NfeD family protein [Promethearchaeota archaeon]
MDDIENSEGNHTTTASKRHKKTRGQLLAFILFSIIEEAIIGIIAFLAILFFAPFLLLPGVALIIIGLGLFTILKIYFFMSSGGIPIEHPVIGQVAIVLEDFSIDTKQWSGKVRLRGEIWRAAAKTALTQGSTVRVIAVEGLCLFVENIQKSES